MRDLSNIPPGQTQCSVCGILKENTEFSYYANQFYSKGKDHPWTGKRKRINTNCKHCTSIKRKDLAAIRKQFSHLKPPAFGERCECCKKPVYESREKVPTGVDGTWVWQLDHDHETGQFRGWLCKQCNTGLGNLGDTLESLKLVVEYLERSKENANPSQLNNLSRQRILLEDPS